MSEFFDRNFIDYIYIVAFCYGFLTATKRIPLYICYEYLFSVFSVISLNLNAIQDKRDNGSELGCGLWSRISLE